MSVRGWCRTRIYTLVRWCLLFKQKTAYEMRISDWSSDVCSSDLRSRRRRASSRRRPPPRRGRAAPRGRGTGRSGSCRLALAGGQPCDLQEIGEHRMTMLGRDAFGVELDAVDRQIGVAETHQRAVVARRVDDEVLGNVERSEEH